MSRNQQSAVVRELARIDDTNKRLDIERNQALLGLRRDILSQLEKLEASFSQGAFKNAGVRIKELQLVDPDMITELSNRFQSLSVAMARLEGEGKTIASDQRFLRSLYFQRFMTRHDKIETAHARTFEWMFRDSNSQDPEPRRFVEWLRSKDGSFWIQGKAGSGKSTLMKFLWHHRSTLHHLQHWAGTNKLVMASYFFWAAGNDLQKSQEGLLRTLLFEILRNCPELIHIARDVLSHNEDWAMVADQDSWSLTSLQQMCLAVMRQELPARFCFFIDGLDEYRGNNQELIEFIQTLIRYPHVKACVSSRPWAQFKHAFGHDTIWKIKLEDLTAEDIRQYTHDRLDGDRQFKELKRDDVNYENLANDVVRRAQGVFLWVFLVIRSLLEGAQYADSIDEMRHRLDRFPEDLEDFFKHMLDDIPPFYRPQASMTFKIATTAHRPLPLVIHSFTDDFMKQPHFALTAKISPLSEREILFKRKQIPDRLDARCKGLLEVVRWVNAPSLYHEYEVDFLHRTVRDFLHNSTEVDTMFQRDLSPEFNPSLILCHAFLADLKLSWTEFQPYNDNNNSEFSMVHSVLEILNYARRVQVELDDSTRIYPVLDETERVLFSPGYEWRPKSEGKAAFLGRAVQFGLHDYVNRKLSNDSRDTSTSYLSSTGRPLLHYALLTESSNESLQTIDTALVMCLLEHGANPNQKYRNETVWSLFLSHCAERDSFTKQDTTRDTIGLLIKHGADLKTRVLVSQTYSISQQKHSSNNMPSSLLNSSLLSPGRATPSRANRRAMPLSSAYHSMNAKDVIGDLYPDSKEELLAQAPSRFKYGISILL